MPFTYLSDYAPLIRGLALETDLELPQSVDLPFDLFLQGRGWHAPEVHGAGWFRWLGDAGDGEVHLLVDRSRPTYLRLEVFTAVNDTALYATKVYCDGAEVETRVVYGGVGRVIEGVLPSRHEPRSGMTTLRIVAPETSQAGGGDVRRLSISFQRVIVTPLEEDPNAAGRISLLGNLLSNFDDLGAALHITPNERVWAPRLDYGHPIATSLYDEPGYAHLKIRIDAAKFRELEGKLVFNLRRGRNEALGIEFREAELSPDFSRIFEFRESDAYGSRIEYSLIPTQNRRHWSLSPIGSTPDVVVGLLTAIISELPNIIDKLGPGIDASPIDWPALAQEISDYVEMKQNRATDGASA